jgi:hypothetical protein
MEPPDWNFTSGNKAILKIFDLDSINDLKTFPVWEASPEYQPDGRRSKEKALEMIERAMKTGDNYFEWVHKRKNGELFDAKVQLTI